MSPFLRNTHAYTPPAGSLRFHRLVGRSRGRGAAPSPSQARARRANRKPQVSSLCFRSAAPLQFGYNFYPPEAG
eukprot:scaffold206533_cov30-Tisochrysis_lutea.AAC.2